jgi:hypothetical protein
LTVHSSRGFTGRRKTRYHIAASLDCFLANDNSNASAARARSNTKPETRNYMSDGYALAVATVKTKLLDGKQIA